VQLAQAAKLGAGIVQLAAQLSPLGHRAFPRAVEARALRNAVQLTVAELAAVESHPSSHPQWVLRKNRASAVVDARVWLAFPPLGMANKCR
jgi:hypothetical protein